LNLAESKSKEQQEMIQQLQKQINELHEKSDRDRTLFAQEQQQKRIQEQKLFQALDALARMKKQKSASEEEIKAEYGVIRESMEKLQDKVERINELEEEIKEKNEEINSWKRKCKNLEREISLLQDEINLG
jgi:chromosome segregation ATPase